MCFRISNPSEGKIETEIYTSSMDDLQVCVTEELNNNPLLLKKFIQSCDGDIRKTIMQLQFWFQSKKYKIGVLHLHSNYVCCMC